MTDDLFQKYSDFWHRKIACTTVLWVNISSVWRYYQTEIHEKIFWNSENKISNRGFCFNISAGVDLLLNHKSCTVSAFLWALNVGYMKHITLSNPFSDPCPFYWHSSLWVSIIPKHSISNCNTNSTSSPVLLINSISAILLNAEYSRRFMCLRKKDASLFSLTLSFSSPVTQCRCH